jgi:hypothetical protein
MTDYSSYLQGLLDGPCRKLRQENHIDPSRVLVYEQDGGIIQSLTSGEIRVAYPFGPFPFRWCKEDYEFLWTRKAHYYYMSSLAHYHADERRFEMPRVGTVLLAIPAGKRPYKIHEITSLILPQDYQ